MAKVNRVQTKTWIAVSIALSIMIIGVSGCGTKSAASSSTAASAQSAQSAQSSSSSSSSTAAASKSTTNGTAQGQKPALNPAVQAAMEIRHLQSNQAMALTTDQKTKVKPILQTLIDTTNPTQDFLQQKADAITAVFTEQQKTYLKSQQQNKDPNAAPNGNSAGTTQNGQGQSGQASGQANATNKPAQSFQPQDIYKQVLNSLT